jgi:hypothetical protein
MSPRTEQIYGSLEYDANASMCIDCGKISYKGIFSIYSSLILLDIPGEIYDTLADLKGY